MMERIPDHPIIRDCERYGYPRWMCEKEVIGHCAVCGAPIFSYDEYEVHGADIVCDFCTDYYDEEG